MTAPRILQDGPITRLVLPFAGSILINSYDLCALSSGNVVPVSSLADGGTLAINQAAGAAAFLGAAMDSRAAADTAVVTDFPVGSVFIGEYDCASTTWSVGNLIGLVEDVATGTYLEKKIVAKVTDPNAAIGVCVLAGTSVTRVKGVFRANAVLGNGGSGQKIRAGTVTLDGSNPTPVVTGLTTILAATVSLKAAATPGDDPTSFSVGYSGGTLSIYAYKTDGADPTLVASTNAAATVDWIAVGF